jgi:hypothetical protein
MYRLWVGWYIIVGTQSSAEDVLEDSVSIFRGSGGYGGEEKRKGSPY